MHKWLEQVWRQTTADADALHHALLLSGADGVGKLAFAESLAQFLLCTKPDAATGKACEACQNCRLFKACTHPDFHVLISEATAAAPDYARLGAYANRYQDAEKRERRAKASVVIPIDQVRLLIQRFTTHAHIARRKVALIAPADAMNINAANALLKLLEEPPANAFFLLPTALPGFLPATIRSRCMQIKLPTPSPADAVAWLGEYMPPARAELLNQLAGGGPLRALSLEREGFADAHEKLLGCVAALAAGRSDGVEISGELKGFDLALLLRWLQAFIADLIKWRSGFDAPAWRGQIALSTERIGLRGLFFLHDKIAAYQKIARDPINAQLALEDVLLHLQRVLQPR